MKHVFPPKKYTNSVKSKKKGFRGLHTGEYDRGTKSPEWGKGGNAWGSEQDLGRNASVAAKTFTALIHQTRLALA